MAIDKLTIDENVTVAIDFTVLNAQGAVQDVSGWTFEFMAKDAQGLQFIHKTSPGGVEILDAHAGIGVIHIDPLDTKGHSGPGGICQLRAVDGFGAAVKLFQRALVIRASVI